MIISSKRAKKARSESQSQLRGAFTNLSSQDNRAKEAGLGACSWELGALGDWGMLWQINREHTRK